MRQGPMFVAVDASAPSRDVKHETVGRANLKLLWISDGDFETGDRLKSAGPETTTGPDQDFGRIPYFFHSHYGRLKFRRISLTLPQPKHITRSSLLRARRRWPCGDCVLRCAARPSGRGDSSRFRGAFPAEVPKGICERVETGAHPTCRDREARCETLGGSSSRAPRRSQENRFQAPPEVFPHRTQVDPYVVVRFAVFLQEDGPDHRDVLFEAGAADGCGS